MNYLCPDCLKSVEVVIACGCRDYFCNHCNQLVSKKRVIEQHETKQKPQQVENQEQRV